MTVKIARLTIATNNTDTMANFYNEVFEANLQPFEPMQGVVFYRGELAGMQLLMCPNEVAQVEAKQNRQQFNFIVDDIEQTILKATNAGGTIINEIQDVEGARIGAIFDPDGNSIEFTQATE